MMMMISLIRMGKSINQWIRFDYVYSPGKMSIRRKGQHKNKHTINVIIGEGPISKDATSNVFGQCLPWDHLKLEGNYTVGK